MEIKKNVILYGEVCKYKKKTTIWQFLCRLCVEQQNGDKKLRSATEGPSRERRCLLHLWHCIRLRNRFHNEKYCTRDSLRQVALSTLSDSDHSSRSATLFGLVKKATYWQKGWSPAWFRHSRIKHK